MVRPFRTEKKEKYKWYVCQLEQKKKPGKVEHLQWKFDFSRSSDCDRVNHLMLHPEFLEVLNKWKVPLGSGSNSNPGYHDNQPGFGHNIWH